MPRFLSALAKCVRQIDLGITSVLVFVVIFVSALSISGIMRPRSPIAPINCKNLIWNFLL